MLKIALHGKDDIVVISLLGTLHNILGLLQHEEGFDFYLPENSAKDVCGEVTLIPNACLSAKFDELMRRNKLLAEIAKHAPCSVYHLSTSAPKKSNHFIADHASIYRGEEVSEANITLPNLRLKLWKIEMSILEKLCLEWGLKFLTVPEYALCDDGFLKECFYADDVTHANTKYGELVLEKLKMLVSA